MFKYPALVFLVAAFLNVLAQTPEEKVAMTIKQPTIEGHIYFLASDELRGRETGSPEIDIAAKYIATSLQRYGVKPVNGSYYQDVALESVSAPSGISVAINKEKFDYSMNLAGGNFQEEAEGIYLGFGLKSDFEGQDIKGKIVLVHAGDSESTDIQASYASGRTKYSLARELGAVALVEIFSDKPENWDGYAGYFNRASTQVAGNDSGISHVWVVREDTEKLKLKNGKKVDITLNVNGIEKKSIAAKNVVGMVEGSDPDLKEEYIIYSGHYDHVGVGTPNVAGDSIYNGARDNATGVVTVMSMAENLAKFPTKRSALFILFTGEEKGLLGSKYYVENPLIPLNQMVFCFNSDNGGYNDTSLATIIGLGRTTESTKIIDAASTYGLKAIDDPAPEQGLFDRSDNVHFARIGIPAPTYSLGFTAFDAEIQKYYHKVEDNPETLDYDYLYKFFQSYVLSGRLIGDGEETPFWTEGDKYYDAGVQLYGKR